MLESPDFNYEQNIKWYCIYGGAQELAKNMEKKLRNKPIYDSAVTQVKAYSNLMKVKTVRETKHDGAHRKEHAAVFNSTTLVCLKRIDTRLAGLNLSVKQATRSLGYGHTAKVEREIELHYLKSGQHVRGWTRLGWRCTGPWRRVTAALVGYCGRRE